MILAEQEKADLQDSDFGALLDDYLYESPYRGQILEATVLAVSQDEVLLDVGLKRDAVVTRKDLNLLNNDIRDRIVPGATVLTYVLQPRDSSGDLIVSINKAQELEDWKKAQEAQENDKIVNAEVIDTNRGGLLIRYGRLTGFVPQSHIMSLPRFASQDELHEAKRHLLNTTLALKFIEINRKRNRLILSERNAHIEMKQSRMEELNIGDIVKGRVVSIVDFGAFVDLGGVDGLIHISKLAHNHVNHPGEVLTIGDEVTVLIDNIDIAKDRISLDRTAVIANPWDSVLEELKVHQLIEGIVTNVVDFGVFVQLPNGLQGLVHLSQMTMFGTQNPRDVFTDGDTMLARIIEIEPGEKRIALSIDDVSIDEQENWLHTRHEDSQVDEVIEQVPQIPVSE